MLQSRVFLLAVLGVLMAVAPAGAGTMYTTNDASDFLFRVDVTTGNATAIGQAGVDLSFTGLAYDTSTGTLYVSDAYDHPVRGLGIVDPATGAVAMVGSHVNSINIHGLADDFESGDLGRWSHSVP
jgi:hypothetical protein